MPPFRNPPAKGRGGALRSAAAIAAVVADAVLERQLTVRIDACDASVVTA
jgi:hypothetical protein